MSRCPKSFLLPDECVTGWQVPSSGSIGRAYPILSNDFAEWLDEQDIEYEDDGDEISRAYRGAWVSVDVRVDDEDGCGVMCANVTFRCLSDATLFKLRWM